MRLRQLGSELGFGFGCFRFGACVYISYMAVWDILEHSAHRRDCEKSLGNLRFDRYIEKIDGEKALSYMSCIIIWLKYLSLLPNPSRRDSLPKPAYLNMMWPLLKAQVSLLRAYC